MSLRTASGRSASTSRTPSTAVDAVTTSAPQVWSAIAKYSRLSTSSSTTTILRRTRFRGSPADTDVDDSRRRPRRPGSCGSGSSAPARGLRRRSGCSLGRASDFRILADSHSGDVIVDPSVVDAVSGREPRERNRDREGRAAAFAGALRADLSTVQLGQVLHQGQAQPQAAVGPGVRAVLLPEWLEDVRQNVRTDADAVVGHGELGRIVRACDTDLDPAARGGELDGVHGKVPDHLP